ncbi:MAG: hypothetical protein HUU41_20355 [Bryobacteraceae bacterium]|nr:hypothetical protein [Bryobacterales bacterium]MEB2363126.1 hypothetical protein [Bryobacterales bacterium]NUN03466.1 hypothetical protein [Bryobacteraceae bacterium]
MPTDHTGTDHLEVRHETKDVNIRAIVIFGIGLAAVCVLVLAFLAFLFGLLERVQPEPAPTSALEVPFQPPPEPRLQVRPSVDMERLNAFQDNILNRYGWVDRSAGVVRIPIDRAMEIVAERGIPKTLGAGGPEFEIPAPAPPRVKR